MPHHDTGIDIIDNLLIIFLSHLKVSLGMSTNGTSFGSFLADYEMTAVTAFPHDFFALFKDFLHFYIAEKFAIALFV